MKKGNIVFEMLGKFVDLFVLNLLFILCCLPVITAGASICALYNVSLRSVRYGDGYVIRTFFDGFKKSFKQATMVWLGVLTVLGVLYVDYRFWSISGNVFSKPMLTISAVILFAFLMILQWLFPLMSKADDPLPVLVKNAALMSVGYFVPYTLACLLISAGAVFAVMKSAGMMFIMIIIGFALISYLKSFFLYKVFAKHMQEESAGPDDLLYNSEN